jgi:hypothetical protein
MMSWRRDVAGLIRQLALGTLVLFAAMNVPAAAQNITNVSPQNEAVNAEIREGEEHVADCMRE